MNLRDLTPKVVVKAGGTFDLNGLATERSTVFLIAGADRGAALANVRRIGRHDNRGHGQMALPSFP